VYHSRVYRGSVRIATAMVVLALALPAPALLEARGERRRGAETRRVELEVGGDRQRVEIELPIDHAAANKSRIAFRPRKWKLFPRAD
jgi:hypothetical protein